MDLKRWTNKLHLAGCCEQHTLHVFAQAGCPMLAGLPNGMGGHRLPSAYAGRGKEGNLGLGQRLTVGLRSKNYLSIYTPSGLRVANTLVDNFVSSHVILLFLFWSLFSEGAEMGQKKKGKRRAQI